MAYCGPRGIPRSIFLGRPWPAPGEPMWTEDDTDVVIAWQRDQAERCPRCGTKPSDWPVDEEGRLLPDPPLDAVVHECIGCGLIHDKRKELEESGAAAAGGLHVGIGPYVEPKDG